MLVQAHSLLFISNRAKYWWLTEDGQGKCSLSSCVITKTNISVWLYNRKLNHCGSYLNMKATTPWEHEHLTISKSSWIKNINRNETDVHTSWRLVCQHSGWFGVCWVETNGYLLLEAYKKFMDLARCCVTERGGTGNPLSLHWVHQEMPKHHHLPTWVAFMVLRIFKAI